VHLKKKREWGQHAQVNLLTNEHGYDKNLTEKTVLNEKQKPDSKKETFKNIY
jgi:hypothetical protein